MQGLRSNYLKKTKVLGQNTAEPPATSVDDYELDDVDQFTYLDSTITDNLCLDSEIGKRIRKAATYITSVDKLQAGGGNQGGLVQSLGHQHTAGWQ